MQDIEIFMDDGPVDIQRINDFEHKTGYSFPHSYKEFISKHNAAYHKFNLFDFYNTLFKNIDERDISFYGYGNHLSESNQIDRSNNPDDYMPGGLILIGRSANGDYICFDYRKDKTTDNPPIMVMYHDAFNEDNTEMYVDFVADTFDDFMDSLYAFDDNDQKVYR